MPTELVITVNGKQHVVRATPETPLLFVLRNELELNGPQFGCGLEQCGTCMVLVGARATLSCRLPVADVAGSPITTLEGLSSDGELHPVQQALLDTQAGQCGFCLNGMVIAAAALLNRNANPTDAQIRSALDGNLCRCGVHLRILRAVEQAAAQLNEP